MSKTTERYGACPHQTSKLKIIYTLLKLLSSKELSTKPNKKNWKFQQEPVKKN